MGDSMASSDSARERLCGMCVQQVIYCKHNKDVFFILEFGFICIWDWLGEGHR